MSYGAAGRRDARRQVSLATLERKVQAYKDLMAETKVRAVALAKKKSTGAEAEKDLTTLADHNNMLLLYGKKLAAAQLTVINTQANMGKGTSALGK